MRRTFAAADIGSNTVHLLVAESDGRTVTRCINQTEWLSLGEAVTLTGEIPPEKSRMLLEVLREFKLEAERSRSVAFYVFATEAMRIARNGAALLKRIETEVGVQVDLISPAQEAQYSLTGISLDSPINGPTLLFEVGGGSAQIALCNGQDIQQEISLPLGTGKLLAQAQLGNPASAHSIQTAQNLIQEALGSVPFHEAGLSAIGSGGVIRGLWRALHPDMDKVVHLEELEYLIWSTARLSVNRISQRFNVKQKRAAALLPGALVYSALLKHFLCDHIRVSEYGVREGAILMMSEGKVPAWRA